MLSERSAARSTVKRRRRANVKGGRQHAHLVKVSAEEEGLLLQRALEQGISVPRLLVEAALADEPGETVTQRREFLAELFTLHRMLAAIGNNINQIARVANSEGRVPREKQDELSHALKKVLHTAHRVDESLDRWAIR